MSPELYALLDTVSKIGLGALISGFAGYLIAKASHRHDFRKEAYRRRLDRLETIALAVEAHYHVFFELWAIYRAAHIRWQANGRSGPDTEDLERLTAIANRVETTAVKILDAEGYSHLLGEPGLAKKLEEFKLTFADFQKTFLLSGRFPPPSEIVGKAAAVETCRNGIFSLLSNEFKRADL